MEKDFWLERWEKQEIGFHQDEINPYLQRHGNTLQVGADREVFVPLCGKSIDMMWLRQQGHSVLGVELSPIAIQDFFEESGLAPSRTRHGQFECSQANGIRVLCGDFFDLGKEDLANVGAVYDRASMIALPPEMRKQYARHLASVLPPATKILLIAVDYPQAEMNGPPFALPASEVETLYRDHADIRLLARHDVLAENPRFQQRGLTSLHENVFLLTLRGPA